MCIIIACESGHRPDDRTIARSWSVNPDGGGVMWASDGTVHVSKGYMDLPAYLDCIHSIPTDCPAVLHMRIGTSGGYGPTVTHPYPVTADLDALHALDVDCPVGIAHNGILPYKSDDSRGISDTVAYIQQVVAPLSRTDKVRKQGGLAKSPTARKRLKATSRGSRLAVLDASGAMRLTGDGWETVSRGVHASNSSWSRYIVDLDVDDWADEYDADDYGAWSYDAPWHMATCEGCDDYDACHALGWLCAPDAGYVADDRTA